MALTLRMVLLDSFGKTVAIVEARPLSAQNVSEARAEADRYSRRRHEAVQPNGFEIVDGEGRVVSRRKYQGKGVYDRWN
jgi:hypothetical protein